MTHSIEFPAEDRSNAARRIIARQEPPSLRTYTPSQAVLAKSAGVFHWTPEGRRLYDFTSGVLVANLGHNPRSWMKRFADYMGWKPEHLTGTSEESPSGQDDYFEAVTMTAYNAVTEVEANAVQRLLRSVQSFRGGRRLDTVAWAASGSEAVQKALWACLARDPDRDIILATRHGFHGKKGLAGAVTGSEQDADRDPRVKFISFPMQEIDDVSRRDEDLDLSEYEAELKSMWARYSERINCLITEPYLGGGGSYHPPAAYLHLLENFCRQHDIMLILDEVQANFGRTGSLYAFDKYGVEPDFVCLGKGLGNGVPVSAVVGRGDILNGMKYGATSDTWSANPIASAAVLATLDEFETTDVIKHSARLSEIFMTGLDRLKKTKLISKVRGEGMVFGIECAAVGEMDSHEVANAIVETCYLGSESDGIHLLGPLAGNVLRVSPPLTMTTAEAEESLVLMYRLIEKLAGRLLKPQEAADRI
ncbi:aspartate aminotransferase family protein [Thalassoroseus pseudoceratinae]|uniref:aspartate aminotransferase family protein n=1 Tax=Thalassoroseus pseudoceratinae TaxID=2713176 RepID=UPI00141DE929|nr:aspartate aminotransferase family protein [Thalassoroseus pseudoceratinae]